MLEQIKGTKFAVRVGKELKEFDVIDVLDINQENLSDEFSHQAAIYAWFSQRLAEAELRVSRLDLALEQVYAQVDAKVRHDFDMDNKKTTETMVKGQVIISEDYSTAYDKLAEVKFDVAVLKSICKALEQRSNMLISLGSHTRQEMRGEMAMYNNEIDTVKENMRKVRGK